MIGARIDALWGEGAAEAFRAPAVFHVTAVGAHEGGPVVLKINEDTPKSATDRFALFVARARADAIVVTGQILRDEQNEDFTISDEDVRAWRRSTFGAAPTTLAVITSGRDIDFDHPAFSTPGLAPLVFTSHRSLVAPRGIEVVHHEAPTPRALVAALHARGRVRISIEAGPTTARRLYDAPLALDEVLLSMVEGPLAPSVVGGAFFDAVALDERFAARSPTVTRVEHGRTWRFSRYFNPRRARHAP